MKKRNILSVVALLLTGFSGFGQDKADWPNFGRYRAANAALPAPTSSEKRVLFMGDSITDGWIRSSPDFFSTNTYIDRGISGQTTPQMLVRFRADVVALKPKVVVFLCGINDIAGNTGPSSLEMIQDNIASMCEIAVANKIKVVLSSVLPANAFPWNKNVMPADSVIALNVWIKAYAAQNKHIYLNYYDALVDDKKGMKPEYAADGIHPTKAGYSVMEPLAQQAIAAALRK
ncbi:SGNH/GDSL hydrolase family protein [Pedobacter duraquae]|uniref:Lysophospholipase L1-like esterase n=1 Tax=Pedobacter duraquae TaxID=425511 RepID=A0A4R6IAW1_9SPHI|nr:SGNH/GDSL hydrolase family protein [Pedobacter duraquae]TDO19042.1 lysophospholipase L1-like esterase [Pedobacter duraquae]